jgi:hypothetical protein
MCSLDWGSHGQASKITFDLNVQLKYIINKKFGEQLIAYFPLVYTHRIKNETIRGRGEDTDTQTARCPVTIRGDTDTTHRQQGDLISSEN